MNVMFHCERNISLCVSAVSTTKSTSCTGTAPWHWFSRFASIWSRSWPRKTGYVEQNDLDIKTNKKLSHLTSYKKIEYTVNVVNELHWNLPLFTTSRLTMIIALQENSLNR